MLIVYLFAKPAAWILPWIMQIIGYRFILKKMDLRKKACIIPFVAEGELSRKLFSRMRSFFRPFAIAAVMALAGWYLGIEDSVGVAFMCVAFVVYGIFLLRLYWRLTRSFGRGRLFYIGLILLPPLFLMILGLGKGQYRPLQLKPVKDHGRIGNNLRRAVLVTVSIVELGVLIGGVGLIAVRHLPPALQVVWSQYMVDDSIKDIKAKDDVITREDMMGDQAASVKDVKPSRQQYFPDHSKDESVVVFTYVVGSDLENKAGFASANIKQMSAATSQGDDLTFVLEAGGSNRWFTPEIDNSSYGRYEIKDGKTKKVKSLPADTCMSEGKTLEDFLKWGRKNYPADRYMLVMWDHGGGVAMGYGSDDINPSKANSIGTMPTSQVIKAIADSGIRFDLIGFDACLMQDIEIAAAMEPYADYYLASEESEGGYGWYYAEAFEKLAKEPGTSTEEFARILISDYDQLNTIIKDEDGKPDTKATLSLVDTTLAKPACERLQGLFDRIEKAVREDNDAYSSIAIAGTKAYNFDLNIQVDLVDFLTIMGKSDYDDRICSDEEIKDIIRDVRACVLYRNQDSAEGINGIAFAFPYQAASYYTDTSAQLKAMSLDEERDAFNVIFSIIAAQKEKEAQDPDYYSNVIAQSASGEGNPLDNMANEFMSGKLTEEDWYIEGFEDYDTTEALSDIPLKETQEGYEIQAPEKIWDIIADVQTMVYMRGEKKGSRVYLGRGHLGSKDKNGHPTVTMDDSWVHIAGQPVCYEAEPVRETGKGNIYSGKVKAKLNGTDDIILHVEWDPVENDQEPKVGHVTGYEAETDDIFAAVLNTREKQDLQAGDTIQFLFDSYDKDGKFIKTAVVGKKVHVTKQGRLKVEDAPIGSSSISIGGALTDIYQRNMTTELVELDLQ